MNDLKRPQKPYDRQNKDNFENSNDFDFQDSYLAPISEDNDLDIYSINDDYPSDLEDDFLDYEEDYSDEEETEEKRNARKLLDEQISKIKTISSETINFEEEVLNQQSEKNSNTPLEAWEEFEQGINAWDNFNQKERENIVKHYAPKIRFIALRMKAKLPKHVDLNELISSGTIGLLEALGKFKPQLAIRFDSYAESRIRGAMIDELRRQDWFPRSLRARVREIDQAVWKLENEHGKTPTTEEIAHYTGLTPKEVDLGLEALQNQLCVSLDAIQDTLSSDGGTNNEEHPFQSTVFNELINKVASIIDTLTPREKLVLSLYYNEELNMREASEVMEITEGRVSQLHAQAITRLRKIFAEKYHDSL